MGLMNCVDSLSEAHVSRGLVIGALAVCLFSYWYIRRRLQFQADQAFGALHNCKPIETVLPTEWPLGLDLLIRQYNVLPAQRLLAFQSEFFDEYGPNFRFRVLGTECIMTTDPKNIEAMLSTRFEDWGLGARSACLFSLVGRGIFTLDGRPWKHSRDMLRRQFVRIQYQNLAVFDQHIADLISGLASAADAGGVVDVQPFFFHYTLSTTTNLIFGEPVGALGPRVQRQFEENFDYASFIAAIKSRLDSLHWMYNPKRYREACKIVKMYADYFVSQALECSRKEGEAVAVERYPFILELYRDLKNPVLVRDQLTNVLIAGRDTTACLMSWTFFLLIRHPSTLRRLRAEISALLPDPNTPITRPHLAKLPYLKYVLKETLRLYPQPPINVRFANKTTILPSGGGPDGTSPILIRKGTSVGFSAYHMHRRIALYGHSACEFNPSRWKDGTLEKKLGYAYLPFHKGPRICLGKDFALTEASYAIVRIFQSFPDLRLPPNVKRDPTGQEKQSLTMVVASGEGCKVLLR